MCIRDRSSVSYRRDCGEFLCDSPKLLEEALLWRAGPVSYTHLYDDLGKDMRVEPIPADMVDLANEYREKLMDAVSMVDESIMEAYLAGEEVPTAKIRAAIRKATICLLYTSRCV